MPDITFEVSDLADVEESENLERALSRLEFVDLVNVDSERGLVAVSYEGGEAELRGIRGAMEGAGHKSEPPPRARPDVGLIMPASSLSVSEAARFLDIPEEEAR